VLDDLKRVIDARFSGKTGIVYCLSKDDCEKVAAFLPGALPYHAELPKKVRAENQLSWSHGACKIICATVAFCMSIDKKNVRFFSITLCRSTLRGTSRKAAVRGEPTCQVLV